MDWYCIDLHHPLSDEKMEYIELQPKLKHIIKILKEQSEIKDKEVYCVQCGEYVDARGDLYEDYTNCECRLPLHTMERELAQKTEPYIVSGEAIKQFLEDRKTVLNEAVELVCNNVIAVDEIPEYINYHYGDLGL